MTPSSQPAAPPSRSLQVADAADPSATVSAAMSRPCNLRRPVCAGVASLSFAPIVFCLAFGIWAPAAIIWETFGVHYTALPTFMVGYHVIGNAMAYAVVYAYGPSLLVHGPLGWLAEVDRFQVYTLLLYAEQGALVTITALWLAHSRCRYSDNWCWWRSSGYCRRSWRR